IHEVKSLRGLEALPVRLYVQYSVEPEGAHGLPEMVPAGDVPAPVVKRDPVRVQKPFALLAAGGAVTEAEPDPAGGGGAQGQHRLGVRVPTLVVGIAQAELQRLLGRPKPVSQG